MTRVRATDLTWPFKAPFHAQEGKAQETPANIWVALHGFKLLSNQLSNPPFIPILLMANPRRER